MSPSIVRIVRVTMSAIGIAFVPTTALAQSESSSHPHVEVPAIPVRPEDVSTLDSIVAAYYEVVSGPAGQARQWARDRTLYWPGIRFFQAGVKGNGAPDIRVMTHQEYVDASNPGLVRRGFDEHEIHRVTHRLGNLAHIMSTYETRERPDGPLLARGVNSLDLVWDGTRWWITAASWADEQRGTPIPPELLR